MRGEGVLLTGVSMGYGSGIDVVRDVTLEVGPGETLALLGPSGCGKTSLLRAVAGLEHIRAGTIAIGSRTVSGPGVWVRPERRQVGMVFQDGALFPHLSVARNVAFGLRHLGRDEARRRVEEVLALVELDGYADRSPGTLSGGQQQRVALARSLAPSPSVLLLDEPFSALDAALRVQVRTEVARLLREIGVTTVFVTHDQDEAFVLGDRVAVMRSGVVEQVGRPDELYERPATPWVAGFVGEANLLPGRIEPAPGSDGENGTVGAALVARTALGPVALAGPRPVGDQVVVLVRPEQVTVAPGDGAVVELVEYYGHDVRYDLAIDGGGTVTARCGPGSVLPRGSRVAIGFRGPAAVAWPAGAGAGAEAGGGSVSGVGAGSDPGSDVDRP